MVYRRVDVLDFVGDPWWPSYGLPGSTAVFFRRTEKNPYKERIDEALGAEDFSRALDLMFFPMARPSVLGELMMNANLYLYAGALTKTCPGVWYYFPLGISPEFALGVAKGALESSGFDVFRGQGGQDELLHWIRHGTLPPDTPRFDEGHVDCE